MAVILLALRVSLINTIIIFKRSSINKAWGNISHLRGYLPFRLYMIESL